MDQIVYYGTTTGKLQQTMYQSSILPTPKKYPVMFNREIFGNPG